MAKVTFDSALSKLASTLHAAHVAVESTIAKTKAQSAAAFNAVIDAGLAAKKTTGEIKEPIGGVLDECVTRGDLTASTAKCYKAGLSFALDHGVAWSPSLHTLDAQLAAFAATGREMPKALKEKVAKAEAKKAEKESAADKSRGARTPVAKTETMPPAAPGAIKATKTDLTAIEAHLISLWRRKKFDDLIELIESEADKSAAI